MKLAKILAMAALAMLSTHALAFTPPYHINGNAITGTATFKSGGGCKVPAKKFTNAQFGSIQDSTNANVGTGVISADGAAILAVSNSAYPGGYIKFYQNSNPPPKTQIKVMASYIDNNVLGYIVAESGCLPMNIWTSPTSYVEQKVDGAGGSGSVIDISLKQAFVGQLQPVVGVTCEQGGGITNCNKLKKFSGGMTFKGRYVVP